MATLRKDPVAVKRGDKTPLFQVKFECKELGLTGSSWYSCKTRDVAEANAIKTQIELRINRLRTGEYDIPPNCDPKQWILWGDAALPNKKVRTLTYSIDDFVQDRNDKASDGEISQAMATQDYYWLKIFRDWLKPTDILNEDTLARYKKHWGTLVRKSKYTAKSRKHALNVVSRFSKWLYSNRHIEELPRNLDNFVPKKTPEPAKVYWKKKDFKVLFDDANDKLTLYMLLAINCGYTQMDIASLTHDMVDFTTGLIKRVRHKTQNKSEMLQSAKLWPETSDLLKKQMTPSKKGRLMLVRPDGRPLVEDTQTKTRLDKIGDMFRTFRKHNKDKWSSPRLTFKSFRKTGTNMIAKEYPQWPHLQKLYLADDVRGVVKNYADPVWTLLYTATDWIRDELDIEECLS